MHKIKNFLIKPLKRFPSENLFNQSFVNNRYFGVLFLLMIFSVTVVSALDIGYVVRTPSNLDVDEAALKGFLNGEGHTTVILDDMAFDESVYDLIIVSESVSDIGNIFDHTSTRTIFMSNTAAKAKGLSSSSGLSSGRFATIEKSEGITDSYSLGDLQVYGNQDTLEYLSGCFPINSKLLVSKSDNSKPLIATFDTDALLIDSGCTDRDIAISERNLYFGLISVAEWNSNAEDLFRNSIDWLNENSVKEPPVIDSFSPSNVAPSLTENTDTTFNVVYSDLDNIGEVSVKWKLDNLVVAFGDSYIFNQAIGDYEVISIVDDGDNEVQQVWDVSVVAVSSLTCSASGGDICTSSQICSGSLLDAGDTNICCSVTCTEEVIDFSKANTCEFKESDIEIDLINIDNGENYDIGEDINISVRIRNRLNDDKDFEVRAYFYDLTDDKIIEKESDSLKVKEDKNHIITFTFPMDDDIDEDHDYALLVVAEDDECNQEYERIDIERADHEIIVERVDFSPSELVCGSPLNVEVKVKNIGGNDEDVYLRIVNSKLKIDLRSEGFDLDNFGGDDDTGMEEFNLQLPDNVKSGSYTLRTELYYNNKVERFDEILTLGLCGNEEVIEDSEIISLGESADLDGINLGGATNEIIDNKEEDLGATGGSSVFRSIFLVFLVVFLGVAGFVVYRQLETS